MRKTTAKAISSRPGAGYSALIERFPLRPLRNDSDLDIAVAVLNDLIDRDSLDSGEEDYLEILGLIVSAYEDSIYERPEFSGVDRVRYLMEENGLSQADVARETGIPAQSLSDILNGKRRISPKAREKLAERFGVPAFLVA